jgi:ElaB/YqjD/DUF883 family membrane-anchored ribosome-binding protein
MATDPAGPLSNNEFSRTRDAKEEIEVDMSTLRADMQRLKEDLFKLRDHLGSFGSSRTGEARATAEARLAELQNEFDRLVADARLHGRDTAARIERNVHERPFASLGIAMLVGMLVALFMGRR